MPKKLLAAALVLALLAGGAWLTTQRGTPAGPGLLAADAQTTDPASLPAVPEMVLGEAAAPVTVMEYASFTCPHCAHFHATVWPELKANYIDTGKVRFVYREVYFDRYGLWAAMVARCGGPVRYFGIADLIFDHQKEWLADSDPAVIVGNLRTFGKTAGLTDAELDTCLGDKPMAEAMVANYQKTSTADNVEGTPTFFVDGKKYSNMDYDAFAKILDTELAAKAG